MIVRPPSTVALISGALLAVAGIAVAGDRPAEEILADYRAVELPKLTGDQKDVQALRKFRQEHHKADLRRGELALELFRAHPDHEQVPELLLAQWPGTMMDPAMAGATAAEIDRAMPLFKDARQARTALYMRSIATIVANRANPDAALPAVDDFIRRDPKDPRSAMLLAGFADGVEDLAFRTRLLRRLVADYPEAPASKSAAATLALLDKLGKPLDLEFVDAIKGQTVSIKGLRGKIVVLDFWATWCGPCVAEMPTMKKLYAEYHDKGVEFIGISLDYPKEEGGLDKLKAFVAKNEIAWPQYYQGNGFESEFSSGLGIAMIPQVFLVDAEGNLASVNARGRLETLLPEYLSRAKSSTRP